MLTRISQRGFIGLQQNNIYFGARLCRYFKDDCKNPLLPGGGLDKLQGGIKEEKYFNSHDLELITKIREEGSRLKCENCIGNWAEFEKVLDASIESSALRETCSMNKHKNCKEEAFFLNEQNDNVKLLSDKLKNETSLKIPQDSSSSSSTEISKPVVVGTKATNTPQNPPVK